jgi:hypothetical protein
MYCVIWRFKSGGRTRPPGLDLIFLRPGSVSYIICEIEKATDNPMPAVR